ncbi:MAG: hypothetical protein NW223_04555 [Hyphomicrobiaceae bacterium]|nr:hypothetical protein [Hyphomicrobiaceae bacterium]
MLERVDDGLWCLASHFVTWGCRGSLRMSVLQTSEGLLLYSPVALGPSERDTLAAIGPVATIVAPNLFHHFHLRAAAAAYPAARVLVPAGLEAKIGPIPGAVAITVQTRFGPAEVIDSFTVSGHWLRETLLFHRPTRTLVTADMLYNYQAEHYPAERLFFRAVGCCGTPNVPFYHRLAITDRASVGAMIETVRAWAPKRIVMAHGRIVESADAPQMFAAAWSRFA